MTGAPFSIPLHSGAPLDEERTLHPMLQSALSISLHLVKVKALIWFPFQIENVMNLDDPNNPTITFKIRFSFSESLSKS